MNEVVIAAEMSESRAVQSTEASMTIAVITHTDIYHTTVWILQIQDMQYAQYAVTASETADSPSASPCPPRPAWCGVCGGRVGWREWRGDDGDTRQDREMHVCAWQHRQCASVKCVSCSPKRASSLVSMRLVSCGVPSSLATPAPAGAQQSRAVEKEEEANTLDMTAEAAQFDAYIAQLRARALDISQLLLKFDLRHGGAVYARALNQFAIIAKQFNALYEDLLCKQAYSAARTHLSNSIIHPLSPHFNPTHSIRVHAIAELSEAERAMANAMDKEGEFNEYGVEDFQHRLNDYNAEMCALSRDVTQLSASLFPPQAADAISRVAAQAEQEANEKELQRTLQCLYQGRLVRLDPTVG